MLHVRRTRRSGMMRAAVSASTRIVAVGAINLLLGVTEPPSCSSSGWATGGREAVEGDGAHFTRPPISQDLEYDHTYRLGEAATR